MYLSSENRFQRALQPLEASLVSVATQLLGDSSAPPTSSRCWCWRCCLASLKTLAVLLVDRGLQGLASQQALQGYCMLHRLFIALLMHYSDKRHSEIQRRLQQFVRYPRNF